MNIIKNGQLVCSVVLPTNPSLQETFAANELVHYIYKITGQKPEFGKTAENLIIIGGPNRNVYARKLINEESFGKFVPGPEGMIIYSKDNLLLLAGSDGKNDNTHRGTIYAVYEFLERYLECSLSAYSNSNVEAGEYVPTMKNIEISDSKFVKEKCDVPYRCAIMQYSSWLGNPNHELNEKFISWLAKNRYNRILTWSSIYEGFKKNGVLDMARKRGIMFSVGHHESINLFLPQNGNEYFPEKYYETHPEFYKKLADGSRYRMRKGHFGGQFFLCSHCQEGINTFAKNIIEWIKKNSEVDTICLWPSDEQDDNCMCDECKKYSKTANYTYFTDSVAKLVAMEKPDVKIDQIAYCDIVNCETEKICSNIIIDESTWHHTTFGLRKVGKPNGTCLNTSPFEDILLKWKDAGAKVVYYDYFMGNYGAYQRWMPIADEMQAICKRFCEKDIMGLGTQIEVFNMWNNIFNFYSYGRCAYNTDITFENNLERFCKIFGEGSEEIKQIIKEGERILDGESHINEAGLYLMEHIDKELIYSLYEKALKKTKLPFHRNNIRLMRMAFRYSDIETSSPKIKTESHISPAVDNTGELRYMYENFDSFESKKEGYGIAFPINEQCKGQFSPDIWYKFE